MPALHSPRYAQVHEDGGDALAAVLGARIDLVVEEVVVRIVLLPHLCSRNKVFVRESSASADDCALRSAVLTATQGHFAHDACCQHE